MTERTADASHGYDEGEADARRGIIIVFSGTATAFLPFGLEKPIVVGRTSAVGALLPDERLSRQHARLSLTDDGYLVEDLDSRNGTYVDGERVRGKVTVRAPRVIRLADTVIVPCDDVSRATKPALVGGMVLGSALREALAAVARAATGGETLLVRGETGAGKELAAHRFHALGPSAGGPFVAVNCAAIPEGLAERLLFGAKRGAYSGATADAEGYLSAADGGVLFLDEVGELDLALQAKLLRVLETREVLPLGATHGVKVALRFCMATHRDIRADVAAGRFRRDLYHRIAPPEIVLPPLRDRLDEIAQHIADEVSRVAPDLEPQARLVEACLLRGWPGNVRELRKHIRHAAVNAASAGEKKVRVEDLPAEAGQQEPPPADAEQASSADAKSKGESRPYVRWSKTLTREVVEGALRDADGNVSVAARSLGMPRSQLYREMARLGIKPDDVRG